MASKNLTWAVLALCGSVFTVAAPVVTQAADQPPAQTAKADTKQDTLMCRDLEIPGSHIKQRVCGVPAKWSEAQNRLYVLRNNVNATSGPGSWFPYARFSDEPSSLVERSRQ